VRILNRPAAVSSTKSFCAILHTTVPQGMGRKHKKWSKSEDLPKLISQELSRNKAETNKAGFF
jgi:hypothetical protein